MAPGRCRTAIVGLVGVLVVGCGGGSDSPAKAPTTTKTAAPTVEDYLLQADEVPDLTPVASPQTDSRDPFLLQEDGTRHLKHSGFISTTFQPADGDDGAGVSSVMLFKTPAGAREWMAYETSDAGIKAQLPDSKVKRFTVAEVPGAHGWTGPDLHGNAIGQVYWTQGRCMMLIGLEVEGPRVERLAAGVRAIYERTGGTCLD
ncbi:hypothetical protein [Aeromicrobium ginsengisoli]|uniref:DUF3558 domain-containing protein n=1 Tax=Aeromicrobium ginsengisoli TaxID=363867 RepID=A0A5M4FI21_9ACTN|nr:hypothetical protein [Aeromicrobium ginsengisoli]KAA1399602.1 hypothetical protein ESP70_002225 [Aeromicrobium ginsengisoli]